MPQHFIQSVRLKRDQVPSFDRYPFSLDAVRELAELKLHPKVTFLVGENGSGKSTLLEAIAVAYGFNAEGGSINFQFETRRSHSELHDYLRLVKGVKRPRSGYFLRAESFFNVATEVDRLDGDLGDLIGAYGGKSLHEQSHGESFLALLKHRFYPGGLYLMDEPEAALSPTRQMSVISRMHQLVEEGSQFVVATHSPIIMAYPHAQILSFGPDGIREVDYEETEHFQVTSSFLKSRDLMLRLLMKDAPEDSSEDI